MKKVLLFINLCILSTVIGCSQSGVENTVEEKPVISFNETKWDFKMVEYAGDGIHDFEFENHLLPQLLSFLLQFQ